MKTIILLDKFFQEMFCYFAIIHIIKLLSISYIYGKNQFAVNTEFASDNLAVSITVENYEEMN